MRNRYIPKYHDDSDYNTNAPSYYDDLARKQKLIELLSKKIWEYEEKLNLTLEDIESRVSQRFDEWDLRIEKFPENVETLLQEWLSDGTLDHIINDTIFSWKADQSDLDETNRTLDHTNELLEKTTTRLSDLTLNINDFLGSDRTDDTHYFENAINTLTVKGGGTLFLPNGQYNLRKTLSIPSNICIVGADKKGVIIMFNKNNEFEVDTPLNIAATTNRYRYKIGIKTASFGSKKSVITENITFKNITFDWNNVESEPYSITPIAIDSARNVYFENIEVKRAYNTFSSLAGCNVLISFSDNVYFERTILNGADYESLSVRYLSKNVRFNNGQIYSNKESEYGGQTHLFQVATPPYAENWLQSNFGEYKAGTLYVTNSTGIIEGVCSHFGTAHTGGGLVVDNCTFISKENSQLFYGLKSFSNSDGSKFTNNSFKLFNFAPDTIPNVLALDDSSAGTAGNSNFEISGNEVEVIFPAGFYPDATLLNSKPIIGGMDKTTNFNGIIKNNLITIRNYPNRPIRVIGIMGNRINVSDNVISTQNPGVENDGSGMYALYVSALTDSIIKGNIQGGQKIGYGVRFESSSDIKRNIVVDNVFGWVVSPTAGTSNYTENIVERNYPVI